MMVYDFIEYLTDDSAIIELWHCDKEETIYKGEAREIPYELSELEVGGIDSVYKETECLCLNVYGEVEE